jgi:purine-binding chemotaxis protein CheW
VGEGADTDVARLLLVFRIDGHEHALPIEDVVEVVRMVAATPLPGASAWVSGVINCRGRVIPLIDARARLGAPRREPELSTSIVVLETDQAAGGIVVDEVVEVLTVNPEALAADNASDNGPAVAAVVHRADRVILVLDSDHLLDSSAGLSAAVPVAGAT